MRVLRICLLAVVVWAGVAGLWDHDWHLITAAILVAVAWPLVLAEVASGEHKLGCICPECQQRGARERQRRGA